MSIASALDFLRSQQLLVIACHAENETWIVNVYFGAADNEKIYFVSPEDTKHSRLILQNPKVAFSVAWFDPSNHKNRKAIQGQGVCRPAETKEEIIMGVHLHNQNFPEFKQKITVDWLHMNEFGSRVWLLKPAYLKYWDDELYGENESQEFEL